MTRMCRVLAIALAAWPYLAIKAQHVASAPLPSSRTISAEATAVLSRPVTLQLDHVPLRQAIRLLAATAGVSVTYRRELVDAVPHEVTRQFARTPLGDAFAQVLAGVPLRLVVSSGGQLSIAPAENVTTATRDGTITGVVSDAQNGRPLRGVKIGVDGMERMAETAEDGRYRVAVSAGRHTVTARLIGYAKAVRTVVVEDGAAVSVDVALTPSAMALDQVVVTGTVIPTELKAVPNAITVITAKQIEERGITKIDQLFRGDVPGVFAPNLGSDGNALLDEVRMFSRGATALSAQSAGTTFNTNPIKTYVDGIEMADSKYLSQIDPKSIERIEILTGPQASTIYGSNAINGVMQIFTKRGSTSKPQVTLNLLSGFVENDFSSALTPQHDYSTQVSGIEGRLSYNVGGSWNYMGAWTPAKQTARTGAFGGARLASSTPVGAMTADVTFRHGLTRNQQHGSVTPLGTDYSATGWYNVTSLCNGCWRPTTYDLVGQTLGFATGYTPVSWWSQELSVGQDASDMETRYTARGYSSISDTSLQLIQVHEDRRSLRYATTARMSPAAPVQAVVTFGADAWRNLVTSVFVQPQALTGTLTSTSTATQITRQPGHNVGGFFQTQFGVMDRLFITYGLRAEWNPNYGTAAEPNYAPRYGIAYTGTVGSVTAKLRASYGRSTRPPKAGASARVTAAANGWPTTYLQDYGNYNNYIANPDLGPEHQQGGEGGVELYLGSRGSLIVTRYDQKIIDLIDSPIIDSVRSLTPYPTSGGQRGPDANGYRYQLQYEFLNVGSIRNQGWELQGSLNTGPFTTKGTYSWTKSRTIGANPKYRTFFTPSSYPQYQPGAMFRYLPEHTWMLGTTYTRARTVVALDVTGTGQVWNGTSGVPGAPTSNVFFAQYLGGNIRLPQNRFRVFGFTYYSINPAYMMADLNVSHALSARIDGLIQVQNLADRYINDYNGVSATLGRQSKFGFRVRW